MQLTKYKVGLEAIDFQNDSFKKIICHHISELRKLSESDLRKKGTFDALSAEIKKNTNITVRLVINRYGPSVEIPSANRDSVLYNFFRRVYTRNQNDFGRIKSPDKTAIGGVDLQSVRLTGVFGEIKHTMNLSLELFNSEYFTVEEVAAVILHELGHLFTYYEFISRTVSTNLVLDDLSRALSNAKLPKEREAILMDVSRYLKLSDLDVTKLSQSDNNKIIELTVITHVADIYEIQFSRSELGSNIYDLNSWETISDQFATRMGAGRELVTGLDKIHRRDNNIAVRGTIEYLFMEAVKVIGLLGGYVVPFLITSVPFVLSLTAGMTLFTICFWKVLMDNPNFDYARPKYRLKRIKEQLVERMKNKDISTEERKSLSESVTEIDKILKGYNDYHQALTLANFVFSKKTREHYKQEKIQAELESLVSNELFEFYNNQKAGVQ